MQKLARCDYHTSLQAADADMLHDAIAKAAIPYCGLTYLDGQDLSRELNAYLNVLYKYNPDSIGGAIPGEEFYFDDEQ